MKKLIIFVMALMVFNIPNICLALHSHDQALWDDMHKHPQEYIAFGGAGTGAHLFLNVKSLAIEKYAPPEYVISFTPVLYSINGATYETAAYYIPVDRFRYNYATKEIYAEWFDADKRETYWQKITPDMKNSSNNTGLSQALAGSELAFYVAYGISFYDTPQSYYAKKYILEGESTFNIKW